MVENYLHVRNPKYKYMCKLLYTWLHYNCCSGIKINLIYYIKNQNFEREILILEYPSVLYSCSWGNYLLQGFHLTFKCSISCIFQAQLTRQSIRSGYRWKDLFLLHNSSTSDANFGQRWWCQKSNKGQCMLWLFTASTGVHHWRKIKTLSWFEIKKAKQNS